MSVILEHNSLRQRADYTYKFNARAGRHGWLRLTPAYSIKVVEELIAGHHTTKRIFDPFVAPAQRLLAPRIMGTKVLPLISTHSCYGLLKQRLHAIPYEISLPRVTHVRLCWI